MRPVRADVWYPARAISGETGLYFPGIAALAANPATARLMSDYFGVDLRRLVEGGPRSNAYDGAPAEQQGKPFPVLLFSHGLGQSPFAYTIQIEELASHGYVVVALSHVGDALAVPLPDGTAIPFGAPSGASTNDGTFETHHRLAAEDLIFALDRLTGLSRDAKSLLNGTLDLDRVGALGHSSGGRAAIGACLLDSRIRSCLNEDGGLHRPDWLPVTRVPGTFAILDWFDPGLDAEDYAGMRTSPLRYAQQTLSPTESALKTWRQSLGGSYRLTLLKKGMAHTAFTDMRWLTATDANRPRFSEYLDLIRRVTRAYFDQTLRGQSSPLLSCTPQEPDVLVQCFRGRD
jgi:hypothetical protein